MDDAPQNAHSNRPDLHVETEGEFAGWRTWTRDNFETHNGPFWHRMEDDGRVRCAFRVEKKHLNGMRNVHGGCFMTFADYCLFALATRCCRGRASRSRSAANSSTRAHEGELVEGDGEIMRAGGSMIFLRGMLRSGERSLFTFSGTIKRVKWKPPAKRRRCPSIAELEIGPKPAPPPDRPACRPPGAAGATMRCCWRWPAAGARPIR